MEKLAAEKNGIYGAVIAELPLLTAEDEVALAKRIEKGDTAARDELVLRNMRLVWANVKRYENCGLDKDDLVQEGYIGLMRAAQKFDWRLGNRFSTYATWWIQQGMTRALAEQGRTIRLPAHKAEQVRLMRKCMTRFLVRNHCEPTVEDMAEEMGVTVDQIEELFRLMQPVASFEEKLDPQNEKSILRDTLPDAPERGPEAQAIRKLMREKLLSVLETLTPRERKVLVLRYGLNGQEEMTLEQVGEVFHLTRERIRQIEMKALRKLRRPARAKMLKDAL